MYKFKEYSTNNVKFFLTKQDFLEYLDNLCLQKNLIQRYPADEYLIEYCNDDKENFSDGAYDGVCMSGSDFSKMQRACMLGYWLKIDCGDKK